MFKPDEKVVGAMYLNSPVTHQLKQQFSTDISNITNDYQKELQYNSQRQQHNINNINYIKTMCHELSTTYKYGEIWKHAEISSVKARHRVVEADGTYTDKERPVRQLRKTSEGKTIAEYIEILSILLDADYALAFAKQFTRKENFLFHYDAKHHYTSTTFIMNDGSLLSAGKFLNEDTWALNARNHTSDGETYRLIMENEWQTLFGGEEE